LAAKYARRKACAYAGDLYTLSRSNLVAYARALLAEDKAAAQALLVAEDTF
jgi:hypothetical protein